MKPIRFAVVGLTLYLVAYVILCQIPGYEYWALGMFALSPFLLISVVLHVLINGEPSPYTFEERWYDDLPVGGESRDVKELGPS
jgi:prepilin signal peptidase PulO-like enzyme (type II secretory pathway)